MSNCPLLRLHQYDGNGLPIGGSALYFYEAGTSTPKAVYPTLADALAGTNALANPLEADANGKFARYFLVPGEGYKVRMYTDTIAAGGTLIWEEDDVYALESSSSAGNSLSRVISPFDYGAVGDGATDDYAAIQAAIDAASNLGYGQVFLHGATFRCDSNVGLKSNVDVVGPGRLDFRQCTDDQYLSATGSEGSTYVLDGDEAYRAASVESAAAASGASIEAGDIVRIRSNQALLGSIQSGELVEVSSISGAVFTLDRPLTDDYNVSDSAAISLVTPMENIRFRNGVRVKGSPAASGTPSVFYLERVRNVSLDVVIEDVAGYGIYIKDSVNVRVEPGSIIENSPDASDGIGIYLEGAGRDYVFDGVTLRRLTTGIDTVFSTFQFGAPLGVRIRNCAFAQLSHSMRLYEHMTDVRVERCTLYHCDTTTFRFTDGVVSELHQLDTGTISVLGPTTFLNRSNRPWYYRFVNNKFEGAVTYLSSNQFPPTNGGGTIQLMELSNNRSSLQLVLGLTWSSNNAIGLNKLVAKDNHVLLANEGTFFIDATGTGASVGEALLVDSDCQDVSISDVDTVRMRGVTGKDAVLTDPTVVDVTDCKFDNQGDESGDAGLAIVGASGAVIRVANCDLRSDEAALQITGFADSVNVVGGYFERSDTSAGCIVVTAADPGDIKGVLVEGAHIEGGNYGIVVTNGHSSNWSEGNTFTGQGTGTVSGILAPVVYRTIADSDAVGSTSLTPFSNGTYTFPADSLKIGDVVRVTAWGARVASGTDGFAFQVSLDGAVNLTLPNTGFFFVPDSVTAPWSIVADFIIRGPLTSSCVVEGRAELQTLQNSAANVGTTAYRASANIDPTGSVDVTVSVDCENASDTIEMNGMIVEVLRK